MPDDVKIEVAAPSAATTDKVKLFERGKLTPEMSRQFMARAQGEQEPPAKQDTAPADTSKETISADDKSQSAAAPDSAKETQDKEKDKGSRRKPSAEERIAELIAENKRLKEGKGPEMKKAEPVTRQPEPKAASVEELKAPVKPKWADFENLGPDKAWEAFEAAKDKYHDDCREYDRKKAIQDFQRESAQTAQQQQITKELAEAREVYSDFDTVVAPAWEALAADKAIHPAVQEAVGGSPLFTHLMYVLGGDKAQMEQFLSDAKTNPIKAIKQIGVMEDLVMKQLEKNKAAKAGDKKPSEPDEKKETPANKKTEEPQPTHEVGNRGTGPNDPAADAVRRSQGKLTKSLDETWKRKAAERFARG